MSDEVSETLLSKILMLVQEIHTSLDEFKDRLVILEAKVAGIVKDGFPEGNLEDHKDWHINRRHSGFRRFLLRMLS